MSHAEAQQPPSLSQTLFKASRQTHSLSNALVSSKLVALFTEPVLYARALGCFYYVFQALEESLDAAAQSESRLVQFREHAALLYRTAAFEEDLFYFLGPGWRIDLEQHSNLPSVRAYVAHLQALAVERPLLVAAHSITQHLALAAGGQMVAKMVRRGLKLPEGRGAAAYTYSHGSARALKEGLKTHFDALYTSDHLAQEEVDALVHEHCRAFAFNNAIIWEFNVGALAPLKATLQLAMRSHTFTVTAAVLGGVLALYLARTWLR